jgi:hypothetical protein
VNEIPAAVWEVETQDTESHSLTVWPCMMQTERSTYVRFEVSTSAPVDYTLTLDSLHFAPLVLQQGELPECAPGESLHFGKGQRSNELLGHGWEGQNDDGVWSGYESVLLFKPVAACVPSSVQFELGPFQAASWPADLQLLILVNGRHAAQLDLRANRTAAIEILPEDLLVAPWLEFRFIPAPLPVTRYLASSGKGAKLEHTVVAFTLSNPSCGIFQTAAALSDADMPITEDLVRQIWTRYDLITFQKRLKAIEANAALSRLLDPLVSQAEPPRPRFILRSMRFERIE